MTIETSTGHNDEIERLSAERVTELAGQLHEEWRETRRTGAGTYEPRIKSTKDAAWIERNTGKTEVDIANTGYRDLPSDWQAENKASAEVAINSVERGIRRGEDLDEQFIERASAELHDKWLQRNGAWAPPEQNVPYEQLSESEKEKDRVIIRAAIGICSES